MSESAEAVVANLKTRRHVTMEIINLTSDFCLVNPRAYRDSGGVTSPPQPTVPPLKTEVCIFSKKGGKATGAVGVLTYDLLERQSNSATQTLAIMFSVPFDYNVYKNWLALGVYEEGKECDEALHKEMYYNKEQQGFRRQEADGCGLTFEGRNLDVKATMCPMGRAIMKVEVWDKVFSQMSQQHY